MSINKLKTFFLLSLATCTSNANSTDNVANIFLAEGNKIKHIDFTFSKNKIVPINKPAKYNNIQQDKFGDKPQLSDGRILLKPKNDKIDQLWEYNASRPGKYWMELVYSLADGKCNAMPNVNSYRITTKLNSTGSYQIFRNINLGKIYFTNSGKQNVELKFKGAKPNVRAVILRPAPEGEKIIQSLDRSILLHSRDATINGTKVQYENKPHKNTVGFWVNTTDKVYWDFTVASEGEFHIEINQGCGRGQGGSKVELIVSDQSVGFIVKDTGHFQNFIPRKIGKVYLNKAEHRLWIKPVKKAHGAIMDVRHIKLIPTK